jgi:hypothetical protein
LGESFSMMKVTIVRTKEWGRMDRQEDSTNASIGFIVEK